MSVSSKWSFGSIEPVSPETFFDNTVPFHVRYLRLRQILDDTISAMPPPSCHYQRVHMLVYVLGMIQARVWSHALQPASAAWCVCASRSTFVQVKLSSDRIGDPTSRLFVTEITI